MLHKINRKAVHPGKGGKNVENTDFTPEKLEQARLLADTPAGRQLKALLQQNNAQGLRQAMDQAADKVSKKLEEKINQKLDEATDSSTVEKILDKILELI